MARLGILKDVTLNTGMRARDSFTVVEKVMLDRANTYSASTVTATAIVGIYYDAAQFASSNVSMQEFSFTFPYTTPCICNGLQPCGEGLADCPEGCGCIESETGGTCVSAELGNTTCTDVWDEALMRCKLLTSQTLLTGEVIAYDYTAGSSYLMST